jgi:pimeloyl-ACP methyl ester carboxylesterase
MMMISWLLLSALLLPKNGNGPVIGVIVAQAFSMHPMFIRNHPRHHHDCQKFRDGCLSRRSMSASIEEGEALVYYGLTKAAATRGGDEHQPPVLPPPSIQRVYETWEWQWKNTTYSINYRVVPGRSDDERYSLNVLLVHGFGANLHHYRYQYNALADAGYTVYGLDLLGFGASDKPQNADEIGFSIELFVQQIQDFIQYHQQQHKEQQSSKPRPWVLAGNSIGGLCCLGVTATAQGTALERCIDSIVLFNASGGMSGFRYENVPGWAIPIMWFVQNVVLGPYWGGAFFRNFKSRENIERILKESGVYANRQNVNEELYQILLEPADDPGAEQVFLAVFGGPAGPTPEQYLQQITVPVLAIWGEQDPWTPLNAGMHPGSKFDQYHKTGDFRLVSLPNVGHCPHDEAPEIVNEIMIGFLNQRMSSILEQQKKQHPPPTKIRQWIRKPSIPFLTRKKQ